MSHKITPKNIYNYFEGNARLLLDNLGVSMKHIEQQVAYRLLTCKDDCVIAGKCKQCGCSLPGRAFSTPSCNEERFPDMMNEEDWNKYKKEKNIE